MGPELLQRRYGAVGGGVLLAGALGYLALVDPHRPGAVFPLCPFRLLTGWDCPGCGGLRMVHDVLHVDLAAAVLDNVFLLLGIPALAAWLLLSRLRRQAVSPLRLLTVIVTAALLWTVVRNLPDFPLTPTVLPG